MAAGNLSQKKGKRKCFRRRLEARAPNASECAVGSAEEKVRGAVMDVTHSGSLQGLWRWRSSSDGSASWTTRRFPVFNKDEVR